MQRTCLALLILSLKGREWLFSLTAAFGMDAPSAIEGLARTRNIGMQNSSGTKIATSEFRRSFGEMGGQL